MKHDIELVFQMNSLLISAYKKALEWRSNEGKNKSESEYEEYKNWYCYRPIWDEFWEIANKVKAKPKNYYDPDRGYEEDMRAMFNAYEWILDK